MSRVQGTKKHPRQESLTGVLESQSLTLQGEAYHTEQVNRVEKLVSPLAHGLEPFLYPTAWDVRLNVADLRTQPGRRESELTDRRLHPLLLQFFAPWRGGGGQHGERNLPLAGLDEWHQSFLACSAS
jgi:hypothetical protein